MKRKLWLLLLCLSAAFLLCVSASAVDVSSKDALITAAANGGEIKLTGDIELDSTLAISKETTFDLNGYVLRYTNDNVHGSVLSVEKGAHLTIKDSNPAAEHKFAMNSDGLWVLDENGSKTVSGGVITGGTGHPYDTHGYPSEGGGGVYIATGGNLTMEGGSIVGCTALAGGGVYVNSAGTFTMTGGNIILCSAKGSGDVYGGGVFVTSLGNLAAYGDGDDEKIEYGFRMSGGSILSCSATSTGGGVNNAYGGGVYVGYRDHVGVFVMEDDSRIENCTASAQDRAFGGGVCVDNLTTEAGLFKMNGGSIQSCEAVSTSTYTNYAHGGGVCVKSGAFEMTGGQIESTCKSAENGSNTDGGVCIGGIEHQGIMRANGGSVECTVMNHAEIKCTDPNGSTTFNGTVKNDHMDGVICGGTFQGAVENHGRIEGGEFYGRVDGYSNGSGYGTGGFISGGTFHGSVVGSDRISGGTFDKKPEYAGYVTFDVRGGAPAPERQVRLNAPATEPTPAPVKGTQTFLGWYTDSECTQRYEFSKAYNERITGDITLYALWSGDRCTMTFDSNGGSPVDAQMGLFLGDTAPEPLDPTKDGLAFLGWFTRSGKHWNFTHDTMTGDIALCAMWSDGKLPEPPEPETFTVSFAANGGEGDMDSATVTEGASFRLPSCTFTAPEGKAFDIWEIDGAKYGEGALYPVSANAEVKVLWKDAGDTPDQPDVPGQAYSITIFPSDGGTVTVAPASAAASTEILLTVTPDSGYHFQRWNVFPANLTISKALGNAYSFKMPASNVVLQAIFEADDTPNPPQPTEFTVTFDANGGSGSMEPEAVKEGTSYLLPECAFTAPEGKEFDAWKIDGARYDVGDPYLINANTTATALWKDIDNNPGQLYSITILTSEGGSITASHTSAEADTQIFLTVAPNSGYLLEQCKAIEPRDLIVGPIDTNVYMFYMPESNVVLQPVFVKYQTTEFTVTFDANGGMPEVSSMETVNGRLPSLPGAIHSGRYRFADWYTAKLGGERVTTQTVFSEDTTVYAHWVRTGGSGGSGGSTKKDPEKKDTAAERKFVDVPKGGYFEDAVDWAVENGITTGTDASHFSPDDVCTRAQAVTFLWRAAGCPQPKNRTMPFTDVPKSSYFYDAVLWAVEAGITKGTSDAKFSPDDLCTRAQIAVFLWRSEGSPLAEGRNPFADVAANAYYADAVLWAVAEDITMGTSRTTFSPDDTCTRAQIVTFLWRCKK